MRLHHGRSCIYVIISPTPTCKSNTFDLKGNVVCLCAPSLSLSLWLLMLSLLKPDAPQIFQNNRMSLLLWKRYLQFMRSCLYCWDFSLFSSTAKLQQYASNILYHLTTGTLEPSSHLIISLCLSVWFQLSLSLSPPPPSLSLNGPSVILLDWTCLRCLHYVCSDYSGLRHYKDTEHSFIITNPLFFQWFISVIYPFVVLPLLEMNKLYYSHCSICDVFFICITDKIWDGGAYCCIFFYSIE